MARTYFTSQGFAAFVATVGLFYSSQVTAQEVAQVLYTTSAPTIDGKIDDEIWQKAVPVTDFTRFLPSEGPAPSGNTEVRFLQDDQNIYIGIRVFDTDYQPKARISPRERINDDDQIGIYIDTVGDARTGYIFYFNPLGIQQDIRYSNGNWFVEWNTIYTSKGNVYEDGYEIEIAIPFRSLRYPKTSDPNWKIIVTRKIPDQGAKFSWPKTQRSHPRMFVQAKPLSGIKPAPQSSGVSIQPTVSGLHPMERESESLVNREVDSWQDRIRPSIDLQWGITSDTGVTATINPDFSQIEGDVRQLNLNQRFAFYYPERRPFFLDNIDFFKDQSSTLYTRSINDPIYGIKLAGRENGTDFGFLHSLDRAPNSSVNELGTPGFSTEELEDLWAINSFTRSRFDFLDQGFIGLSVGDKRIVKNPITTNEEKPSASSDVAGVDFSIPFQNIWNFQGYTSSSWAGNQADMLLGNSSNISISRSPDVGTGGHFGVANTTKDYRNELGFNTQSGNYSVSSSVNHSKGFGERSFWSGGAEVVQYKEYSGNQYSQLFFGQNINVRGIHRLELRGGPTYRIYSEVDNLGYNVSLNWRSRVSSRFRYSTKFNHGTEIDYQLLVPSQFTNSELSTTIRPNQRIRLDCSLNYNIYTAEEQETETATNTYNRLTWQLNQPWGIRLVQQSTFLATESPSHNGSILFTWLKSPGTEAYIGAIWSLSESAIQEQTFFAKYTHLFRL